MLVIITLGPKWILLMSRLVNSGDNHHGFLSGQYVATAAYSESLLSRLGSSSVRATSPSKGGRPSIDGMLPCAGRVKVLASATGYLHPSNSHLMEKKLGLYNR